MSMMTRKLFKFYTEELAPMMKPHMGERFFKVVRHFHKDGYLNKEKFIHISGLNWSAENDIRAEIGREPTAKEIEEMNKTLEGGKNGSKSEAA